MTHNSLRTWAELSVNRHGFDWLIRTPHGVYTVRPDDWQDLLGPCSVHGWQKFDGMTHGSLWDAKANVAQRLGLRETTDQSMRDALA